MTEPRDATDFERQVQDLVFEVLDRPVEERSSWLSERCSGDPALLREVEERLRLAQATIPGLEPVLDPSLTVLGPHGSPETGQTLGGDRAYRLVRELGSGGMGTVWLAERSDGEFRQSVAIKMLSATAAHARSLAARFRTERQILAALDHPGIAKLLDGGTAGDGRQFLVMEYVDGVRVDDYCSRHRLSVRARVQLFVRICHAVEAAHQRLIVHRDLKPANILVTATGSPKLLDFGIAKLLSPQIYDWEVAATEQGRSPLTLRYASPEQVQGTPIGTASDVFSLGVVLYELLTGRSPYEEHLDSFPRLLRAIYEEQPTPPSRALSGGSGKNELPGVMRADSQRGRPQGWAELRGDLDAIVLKALRKEPASRYASVAALAEDLQFYLDGRPVAAREGTRLYRAGKFVRRHFLPIAALSSLFLVVLLAAIFSWNQARLLAAERDRVVAAERQARDEAETARQVTAFLVKLLEPASPEVAQGKQPTLRQLLDGGAERLATELRDRPSVQAPLLEAIGSIYGDLGEPEKGRELLERAVALRRARKAEEPLPYAGALSRLAKLRHDAGDTEEAVRLSRSAWNIRVQQLGAGAEPTLEELNRLVVALMSLGRYDDAAPLLADLVERRMAAFGFRGLPLALAGRRIGPEAEPLARVLHTRGVLAYYLGSFREATRFYEESLKLGRFVYGERHTRIATTLTALAAVLTDLGEYERAIELLDSALAIRKEIQGAEHPDVAVILINRAAAMQPQGRWEEVVRDSAEAERILLATVGEKHTGVTAARNNRAEGLRRLGRTKEALELHRASLALLQRTYPEGHADQVPSYLNIGTCLIALGRYEEAVRETERGHALSLRLLGASHPSSVQASLHLGRAFIASGKWRAGVDQLRKTLKESAASADAAPLVAETRFELAQALDREPALRSEARGLAEEALANFRAADPPDKVKVAEIEEWLARGGSVGAPPPGSSPAPREKGSPFR